MGSGDFIPPHPLHTAVLFLVFNRLDTTKQALEAIRQARPPRLYVAADGPRPDRPGEAEKVQAVRDYVMAQIDWPCEVKTLFREKNLGCKYAVSTAITWFFQNEEMGIILEDDVLPSQSFFWFCEELLEKYKDDMRVWHIGGQNFQSGQVRGEGSYFFSAYCYVWGWATWASRWQSYDVELKQVTNDAFLDKLFQKSHLKWWKSCFKKLKKQEIPTWDYQWNLTVLHNNALAALPNVNMTTNIGFGSDAAHTHDPSSPFAFMERFEMSKIIHPTNVDRCIEADEFFFRVYKPAPFLLRFANSTIKMAIMKVAGPSFLAKWTSFVRHLWCSLRRSAGKS